VTLQDAFAQSINTVAVQLGQEVGLRNVVSVAQRLGIRSPLQPVASLALGTFEVTPLELTAAYASFASMGNQVRPYMVVDVRSPDGNTLYHHDMPPTPRILNEDEGLAINSLMYQVVQAGTGRAAAVPGHEIAGKTGTSADYRDAWFVGFSPELVTGVWVGNDDFSPMKKITGGTIPAQIWSGFMRVALKNVPPSHLPRAEPVPPAVVRTDPPDNGDNVIQRGLDGIGNFFDHLFGGSANAAPHDRSSDAGGAPSGQSAGDQRYAYGVETAPVISAPPPYQRGAPNSDVTQPSNVAPPPQPAQRPSGGEVFVFENGQTGERQIFRSKP
jgi:membrane peptidoglycan carboxypeptidase